MKEMTEYGKGFYVPKWMMVVVAGGVALYLLLSLLGGIFSFVPSETGDTGISAGSQSQQPGSGGSEIQNGIVTSTPKQPQKSTLKVIKKYGPTKLPPYGEMQDSAYSYQYLKHDENGLKAFAKISSTREVDVSGTRIGLYTMEIKMPAGIAVKLLDEKGNYIFCKKDPNPEIGCYYYKFWMDMNGQGEQRDEIKISNQEETAKAVQWEVLIFGSN